MPHPPSGLINELSVVVPVYNEGDILMNMAEQLAPHLDDIAGKGHWQFVLVDNGSRDRRQRSATRSSRVGLRRQRSVSPDPTTGKPFTRA